MSLVLNDDKKCGSSEDGKSDAFISKLLKSRTLLVAGAVDQELAEKVIAQLVVLEAESHDPIKVIISSPGGHVDSGFAIFDMMRFVECPIITVGAGWVASIAVPIFFGGDKDKRFTLPSTRFLLHQPSGGAGGQASDLRIEAQEILKIRQRINEFISAETGHEVEKVARDSDRNFWMSAQEAVEYGLATKIIQHVKEIR